MRKNLRRCICISLLSAMLTLSAACAQNTALYKNCRRTCFPNFPESMPAAVFCHLLAIRYFLLIPRCCYSRSFTLLQSPL